jgi:hypothetical protein
MSIELTNEGVVSPLNHSVEAVLPGLHQRWAQTHNLVTGVKEDLKTMKTDIKEQADRMEQSNQSQKESLSDFLVQFGESLRTERPSRRQVSVATSPGQMEEESSLRPPTIHYNLKQTHDSVSDIYDEWWGIGEYEGKPIRGGFDALERQFKSRWRRHFDGGQVKHISRIKIILQALSSLSEMDGYSQEMAMNELDAVYCGECKKYITRLETYIKSKGWYQKKKRRGKPVGIT